MYTGKKLMERFPMTTYTFSLEHLDTPTGRIVLMSEGNVLRVLDWENKAARMQRLLQKHYGNNVHLQPATQPSEALLALQAYFNGDIEAVNHIQTATNGTEFQKAVWNALRTIPAGQTMSYGELATTIGNPKASRAVGLANGSNPIAIIVPCHRVIGANSSLTGFGGGLERKHWLLDHENALPAKAKLA
jgi:methylated-DNA-[protein]-cysteine S-methyltransferase